MPSLQALIVIILAYFLVEIGDYFVLLCRTHSVPSYVFSLPLQSHFARGFALVFLISIISFVCTLNVIFTQT